MMKPLTTARFGVMTALCLAAVFPQILAGTHSFFFRDYGVLGYPFIHYARECFWRGELPLWNPLSNCGAPFLAQWGTMAVYPFSIIYLLLPLPWGLSLFCLAHLALAAIGMQRLALRWTNHPLAAALAGTAFVFNGFTFACLIWPNYTVALGWMPWVVLLADRAAREGKRMVVLAALASAMQMLSGVPEIIMLTWLIVATLWAMALVKGEIPGGALFGRGLMVVVITAALCAVQLFPFFDLLASSQRERGAMTAKWSMAPWGWANLLVPLFHCFETPQGQFFQYGQEFLSSYYLGAGVLALAVLGLWKGGNGRARALGALTLLGLLLALGNHTPLLGWFKAVLPAAGLVRYPVKFVVLAAFAVPLLAAFAIARLAIHTPGSGIQDGQVSPAPSAAPGLARALALAGGGALAVMGLLLLAAWKHPLQYDQFDVTFRNTLWRAAFMVGLLGLVWMACRSSNSGAGLSQWAGVGALLLIVLDAASHSPKQNPILPAKDFTPNLWSSVHQSPGPQFGQSRLMISPQAEEVLLHSAVEDPEKNFLGKRLAEWSNLNVLDGLPKVNGSSTLQIREQAQVQNMLYAATNKPLEGLMAFLGVSHLNSASNVTAWAERTNCLPLVTAGQRPILVEGTNALPGLAADDFNPREAVYLPSTAEGVIRARDRAQAAVRMARASAHRLEFEVEAEGPTLAVIAQSYHAPWEATVDGKSETLWRANHAFQAVEVPAGKHQVLLIYRDHSFKSGLAVTLAAVLGCGVYEMRRRRLSD